MQKGQDDLFPFELFFLLGLWSKFELQSVKKIAQDLIFAAAVVFMIRFTEKSTELVLAHGEICQGQNIQYIFVPEV